MMMMKIHLLQHSSEFLQKSSNLTYPLRGITSLKPNAKVKLPRKKKLKKKL
jgi:hypothetical protein